jgi:hypothetical protein
MRMPSLSSRSLTGRVAGTARDIASNWRRSRFESFLTPRVRLPPSQLELSAAIIKTF